MYLFATRPLWKEINVSKKLVKDLYREYLGMENQDILTRKDAINFLLGITKKIQEEMESFKSEFIEKLPKVYSDELLNSLFFEVYTRINYIEQSCGVTRQTAATYLNQLVDAGLLEYEKVGRESIYKNTRLIELLSKF